MKRKFCMLLLALCIIITSSNIAFAVKDEFFYSLDNLPKGKLLRQEIDQNVLFSSGWLLEVYEIEATAEHPSAIRVAATNDLTGKTRTIYWQIGTGESLINWPDGEGTFVVINNVPVDYVTGSYDCRDYYNFTYVPNDREDGRL